MRIILTTILMLVCLVAYSATPSYSNFSSNQFAPSGTYTVTVKDKPLLTNIVEHAQLSLTNPAFAVSLMTISNNGNSLTVNSNTLLVTSNRVGISTNSPGCTLDINAPYGANLEFQVCTGGVPVLSVSNSYFRSGGGVNILLIHPGTKTSLGSGEGMAFMPNGTSPTALFSGDIWDFRDSGNPRFLFGDNSGAYYGGLKWDSLYRATKLGVASSEGSITIKTNSNVGVNCSNAVASFQADAQYGAQLQFVFSTNGTPVMVISNGIVGIGKANPGSALDVYGNVNVSSGGLSVDFDVVSGGSRKITWNGNTAGSSPAAGLYGWQSYSGVGNTYTNGAWQIFYGSTLNLSAADNTTNTLVYSDGNALHVTDSLIIHSNVFPITANFGNMGPSDCVFWKSNFTMYLICTNSVDGNATTNKLGGL